MFGRIIAPKTIRWAKPYRLKIAKMAELVDAEASKASILINVTSSNLSLRNNIVEWNNVVKVYKKTKKI